MTILKKTTTVLIISTSIILLSACHPRHRIPGPGKPSLKVPSIPVPGKLPGLPR